MITFLFNAGTDDVNEIAETRDLHVAAVDFPYAFVSLKMQTESFKIFKQRSINSEIIRDMCAALMRLRRKRNMASQHSKGVCLQNGK